MSESEWRLQILRKPSNLEVLSLAFNLLVTVQMTATEKKISVWEFRRKNVKTEFLSPAPVLDVGSACLCSSTWWGKAIESVTSE